MTAITPAAMANFVRAIPDALRPSWLAETWSGVHGARDLRAEVTRASSEIVLTPRGITGSSLATGTVVDGTDTVGRFTREQTLHPGGRLEVHHSVLELDPAAQGTGFAGAFNEHAFTRYAAAGVDDVTLNAGKRVGAYAWARQGFELTGTGATDGERLVSRALRLTRFVDDARVAGRITPEQFERIAPRLHRNGELRADTLVSVRELAAMPEIGRPVLLGRSWTGSRPVERTQGWWSEQASAGTDGARRGTANLSNPAKVAAASGDAARRIAGQLPAALDPSRAPHVFARALAGVGGGAVSDGTEGAALTVQLKAHDEVGELVHRFELQGSGRSTLRVRVERDASGHLVGSEFMSPTLRTDAVRRAMDSAWRDLGIHHVVDGQGVRTP